MKLLALLLLFASRLVAFEPMDSNTGGFSPEIINQVMPKQTIMEITEERISQEELPIKVESFAENFVKSSNVIVSEISKSQFFIEFKPLRFQYAHLEAESDLLINNVKVYEARGDKVKLKMLPLDFIFGFENAQWGSFAELEIQEDYQHSEFVVYSNGPMAKVGFGLSLDLENSSSIVKNNGVISEEKNSESMELIPYLFFSFKLIDNEFAEFSFWNKIGLLYARESVSDLEITSLGFSMSSGLDIMFKVNTNLRMGLGLEFDLAAARVEIDRFPDSGSSYLGVGLEVNIFKMKYLF